MDRVIARNANAGEGANCEMEICSDNWDATVAFRRKRSCGGNLSRQAANQPPSSGSAINCSWIEVVKVTALLRGNDVGNEAVTGPDCVRIGSSRGVLMVTEVNAGNNFRRRLADPVSQGS